MDIITGQLVTRLTGSATLMTLKVAYSGMMERMAEGPMNHRTKGVVLVVVVNALQV